MITAWVKNLKSEADKLAFGRQLKNSVEVLDRLRDLIKEDIAGLDSQDNNFDNPNWPYRRANTDGQRVYAQRILKLINLDQKETK